MKKVISLIFICLFLLSTVIYASDISSMLMRLDEEDFSNQSTQDEIEQEASNMISTFQETIDHDEYVIPEDEVDEDKDEKETNNKETTTIPKVTKTGSTVENFQLTVSDIINIIVISVGIVLIFLGITILIKK